MTKTAATKVIRMAIQRGHGWFDHGSTVAMTCPQCRAHVSTDYHLWARDSKGKVLNKFQQAKQGLMEHLMHDCPSV